MINRRCAVALLTVLIVFMLSTFLEFAAWSEQHGETAAAATVQSNEKAMEWGDPFTQMAQYESPQHQAR